jgi:hypothetical protein
MAIGILVGISAVALYQPLPHLLAAALIGILHRWVSPPSAFAGLYYVLLVLLPLSVYVGTRLLGFNPIAAGLASILILAPSEFGDFSRYGLSYNAYVWRGSGLFTELVALEVMVPALGLIARALDRGKWQTAAAIGLALTSLCHIFFGYIAFVSTAVWELTAPRTERAQSVARAVSIAARGMLLLAWFIIPMMLAGGEVNRSRWEPAYKFDSYGASTILREVFSGRLLDFGRLPVLSLMVGLGALLAFFQALRTALPILSSRPDEQGDSRSEAAEGSTRSDSIECGDLPSRLHGSSLPPAGQGDARWGSPDSFDFALPTRLLILTLVWLALYFGRDTWGYLLILLGILSQFGLLRLESAFELFAILLAAWGLERSITAALNAPRHVTMLAGCMLRASLLTIAQERAEYLSVNKIWGERNLAAYKHDRGDLEAALADVRAILAIRPGRVQGGGLGGTFKIGDAQVYSFLSTGGFDQASYLYHTISLTSDYMVLRNENDPAQEDFFGVRAVLAPADLKLPAFFRKRSMHGRFAVYEASSEGYFSLADIGARYDGPPQTWFDTFLDGCKAGCCAAAKSLLLTMR